MPERRLLLPFWISSPPPASLFPVPTRKRGKRRCSGGSRDTPTRRISGNPFTLHVHSLEYDRSGENVNHEILEIEREGLGKADRIIAVSHRTKRMSVERCGITQEKVSVIYDGA